MVETFNIRDIVARRSEQSSFHVAAEQHVRVEFRNMTRGDRIERFRYGGDVVITCFRGSFVLTADGRDVSLADMDQAVVPDGSAIALDCTDDGTLEMIWSPGSAQLVKL